MSAPRLKTRYDEAVVPLSEEFKYDNPHQIPGWLKLSPIWVWARLFRSKVIGGAQRELSALAGKAVVTRRRSPSRL